MADARIDSIEAFIGKRHTIPDHLQPDQFRLSPDFTVCIIGASQGIGAHIAFAYAKAHVPNLVLAARTMNDLEDTATSVKQINPDVDVITVACDIASAISVKNLSEQVKSKFGRLDLLVCNAAYPGPVVLKISEGEPEWVQQAFNVNTMGTYHAAHYFVPLLLASKNGAKAFFAIGTMASCIRRGIIANTGYCVSKMAQIRLVEYLNEQYGNDGLFALTIHPGAVATKNAVSNTPDDFMPYLVDPPDLCGAVCVWLNTQAANLRWLSGRFILANWNLEQLLSKRDVIIQKDLLKFTIAVD